MGESRMEKDRNNRRARYYTLTAAGRKQLGAELSQFDQMIAASRSRNAGHLGIAMNYVARFFSKMWILIRREKFRANALKKWPFIASMRTGISNGWYAQRSRRYAGGDSLRKRYAALEQSHDVVGSASRPHCRIFDSPSGQFAKSRILPATAILVLALGIGANAWPSSDCGAAFSSPCPIRSITARRSVRASRSDPAFIFSYPDYLDWRGSTLSSVHWTSRERRIYHADCCKAEQVWRRSRERRIFTHSRRASRPRRDFRTGEDCRRRHVPCC